MAELCVMGSNIQNQFKMVGQFFEEESYCFRDLDMPSQVDVGPNGGVVGRGLVGVFISS